MEEIYQEVRKRDGVGTFSRRKSDKQKPVFNRKDKKVEDKRVSQCIICGWGIFKTQEYEWSRDKGLVHTPCEDTNKNEVKDTT